MTHRFISVSNLLVTHPSNTSQEDAVRSMECCIEKIRRWLIHDRLLNGDKTEFIIIGTHQQLNKLQDMNIKVGGSERKPI